MANFPKLSEEQKKAFSVRRTSVEKTFSVKTADIVAGFGLQRRGMTAAALRRHPVFIQASGLAASNTVQKLSAQEKKQVRLVRDFFDCRAEQERAAATD